MLLDRLWKFGSPLFFAPDDGSGGGGGGSGDDSGESDEDQDTGDDSSDTQDGDSTPPPDDASLSGLSQAELLKRLQDSQKHITKLNRESAARRKKIEAFETAEKKRQDESLTETERYKQRTAELEAQLSREKEVRQASLIRSEVRIQALKLGFTDPDDAYSLLDLSEVEFEEETGDVQGIDKLLKALAKSKPYLLKVDDGTDNLGDKIDGREGGKRDKNKLEKARKAELGRRFGIQSRD